MIPSASQLLKRLDRLPHSGRQAEVSLLVRENRDDPALLSLLDGLDGSAYERGLALSMAIVGRMQDRIEKALVDPDCRLRCRAARELARSEGEPRCLVEALGSLDREARGVFFRALRRQPNRVLADALLEPVLEHYGPSEARELLAACSESKLRDWLPRLEYTVSGWRTLTYRHPSLVLELFRQRLSETLPGLRRAIWWRYASAFEPFCKLCPEAFTELAIELAPPTVLLSSLAPYLGRLTRHHPDLVFRLLQRQDVRDFLARGALPSQVVSEFARFSGPQRAVLGRHFMGRHEILAVLLERLAPSQRHEFFCSVTVGLDRTGVIWPDELLTALPHDVRQCEVERMLALPAVLADPTKTIGLLGSAAPDWGRERLQEMSRVPDAEQRAQALAAQIRAAGRYRRDLSSAFALLERLENEQDPVRTAVSSALTAIPPTIFPESEAERLLRLTKWVVQAQDTSLSTRYVLSQLAFRLLRGVPSQSPLLTTALTMLTMLADQRSQLSLPDLYSQGRGRWQAVVDALLSRIDRDIALDDWHLLLELSQRIGPGLWQEDRLARRLERATGKAQDFQAREAIRLWLSDPKTRGERIQVLLKREPSAIALHSVSEHLNRRRQDLLDPFIKGARIKGRFLYAGVPYLPPFSDRFHLWLPRQQASLAKVLRAIARDKDQQLLYRRTALQRWSQLEAGQRSGLEEFLQSDELPLREAALPGFRHEPYRLLEYLGRQEARVAVFLLTGVLRRSTAEAGSRLLETALAGPIKMTSRKELMRLVARPRTPSSASQLWHQWQKEGMARDVKIAILQAAGWLLDRDSEAWQVIEQASLSDDPWLARQLLSMSSGALPPPLRTRYLRLIAHYTSHSDPNVSAIAWTAMGNWVGVDREQVARSAAEGVLNLENTVWSNALSLLLHCCRDGGMDAPLQQTVEGLLQLGIEPEAAATRDRPARQRLAQLVTELATLEPTYRLPLAALLRRLSQGLPDPMLRLRLRLAAQVGIDELAAEVAGAEEMFCLESALDQELSSHQRSPEALLLSATEAAASPHVSARRLSLIYLKRAVAKLGWNVECRGLLLKLRGDPSTDVSLPAQRCWTHSEG